MLVLVLHVLRVKNPLVKLAPVQLENSGLHQLAKVLIIVFLGSLIIILACSIIDESCVECSDESTCTKCSEGKCLKDNICSVCPAETLESSSSSDGESSNSTGLIVGLAVGVPVMIALLGYFTYAMVQQAKAKALAKATSIIL